MSAIYSSAVTVPAADAFDPNSLVLGDPTAQEWLADPNCPLVVGLGGTTDSIDGFLDAAYVNVDGAAPGTGDLWQYFSVPPGCTSAQLQVEAWLPSGVSSATLGLRFVAANGITALVSGTAVLTSTPTVYTLSYSSFAASTLYRAYVYTNGNGSSTQAQAMIRAIHVVPTSASDSFFTSNFIRYPVRSQDLWDNCRAGLIQNLYQAQSPASRYVVDTDATKIYLETYSVTYTSPILVFVDGRYYTSGSGSGGGTQYASFSLPSGRKRVEISIPLQVQGSTSGPDDLNVVTGTFMRGVYAPVGVYFQPAPPPHRHERVLVLGDSILVNNGYGSPGIPLIYFIRRNYPGSIALEAFSGRQLCGPMGINGGLPLNPQFLVDQLSRHDPTKIIVELGTNDFGNTPPVAAATYAAAYASFCDTLHAACPRARIVAMTPFPRANEAVANGEGAVLDDMRNGARAAAATRPFVSVFEGLGVITTSDEYDSPALHPSFEGNAKVAAAYASMLWGQPQQGLNLPARFRPQAIADTLVPSKVGSLTSVLAWWRADAVSTTSSGATVTSFYDKSGNGNNGAITGSPPFIPNIGAGLGISYGSSRPAVHLNQGPIAMATFSLPTPFTWVLVWAMNAIGTFGTNDILISGQGGSGSGVTLFMSDSAGGHQFLYNGAFGFSGNSPVAVAASQVYVGIFVVNGSSSVMNINGTEITANAGTTESNAGFFCLGGYEDQSRPTDSYILEAWAATGAMSASDRALVSAGLQKYYRLTL